MYCRIHCANVSKIPGNNWITSSSPSTNRLYYIIDGQGGYIESGTKIPFKKGLLYLIPALGDIITYTSHKTERELLNHCYANFELVPPIMSKSVISFDPKTDPCVQSALDTLISLCKIRPDNKVSFLSSEDLNYLKNTVIYIVEKMIKKNRTMIVEDKTILHALKLIHSNLSQKFSVADIAIECNLSTNGFIKKFTKHIGETPYSYIKKLKYRTAQALRDQGFTLEEIASKCGYSDATTLSHAISNMLKQKTPPVRT